MSARKTGMYRNYFAELGIDEAAIQARVEDTFQKLFFDPELKIYHEVGDDMGYVTDTGNNDVRTEGMSYAMMMALQMNRKDIFDRLWKWTYTYMYLDENWYNHGYFCWSNQLDGTKNSEGPAPDGEEFFVMDLFFASHRWGDGEGIFEYSKLAKELLHVMIHKEDDGKGEAMFDPKAKMIRFITCVNFSDPSYHLPHFYELCAEWCYEEDKAFMKEVAAISREYLHKACHPETGMSAEYADYDGAPHREEGPWGEHWHYYSDAYRTIANIGLDWSWYGADSWQTECAAKLQKFFVEKVGEKPFKVYQIDGTEEEENALHPVAIIATNAQASLAAADLAETCGDAELYKNAKAYADQCVQRFWDTPVRTGDRRYYDNCLYMFAMLALAGQYRIY